MSPLVNRLVNRLVRRSARRAASPLPRPAADRPRSGRPRRPLAGGATGAATAAALLAVLHATLHAGALAAQTPPPGARAADPFCWRGRPLPHCGAFALFELGVYAPLGGTTVQGRLVEPSNPAVGTRAFPVRAFERHASWSAGAMRNVDARTAVGGAVAFGPAGTGAYLAGMARWRRWAGTQASVEVAAGPAVAEVSVPAPSVVPGVPGLAEVRRPGVLGEVRLNAADLLAVSARGVVVPRAGGRTYGAVFAGASAGSHLAVAGTVGLIGFFALVLSAMGGT